MELQVGRIAVHGLSVTLNKQHTLRLGQGGWARAASSAPWLI